MCFHTAMSLPKVYYFIILNFWISKKCFHKFQTTNQAIEYHRTVAYSGIFSGGGGGVNKLSWGQRTEDRGNGDLGAVAPSQGFHSNCKWAKTVFLLDCYGFNFHGSRNLAQLRNFGGRGGLNPPNPLLRYATVTEVFEVLYSFQRQCYILGNPWILFGKTDGFWGPLSLLINWNWQWTVRGKAVATWSWLLISCQCTYSSTPPCLLSRISIDKLLPCLNSSKHVTDVGTCSARATVAPAILCSWIYV
jgi:hypothetical protein